MDNSFRQFKYFIDYKNENQIFIRFEYNSDFSMKAFVIVYLTKINEVFKEVVKYDYSQREQLHVHYFFKKHPRKEYLNLPPTIDTLFELKNRLELKWQKYLIKFNEE